MPKRPVTDQSDSESDGAQVSAKRTRTRRADESDDDQAGPSRSRHQPAQGGSDGESDVDEEMVLPVPEAVDEEEFERLNTDQIRKMLMEKKETVKGIAEYGIIQAIEMQNFMCHERLSFEFGEQINFIIGHNGSGKSAVLSALTIALGGKTNSTGRGTGLKSFIREGQTRAKIILRIKNEGPEAYKHDQYGDSIVIERMFTKDGSSSWKILDATGKNIISTKRDELSAICDHMNVQVDNPMNVLTQDAARQFLSASHAHDKYKFFLLGTQLFQLSTEYDTCLDNIRKTSKVLIAKKENIPDLRRKFNDAQRKFNEAKKAREQQKKVDELKKEKAWAHVKEKEDEFEDKAAAVEGKKLHLPIIEAQLAEAEEKLRTQEALIQDCEAEVQRLGNVDHLYARKSALTKEIAEHKKKIKSLDNELRKMKGEITFHDTTIHGLNAQIEAERLKSEANSQAKRDALDAKIADAKAKVDDLVQKQEASKDRQRALNDELTTEKADGGKLQEELKTMKQRFDDAKGRLKSAQDSVRDQFVPYGHNIKAVVDEIDRARWMGEKPLGPLGRYVKAKDPQKWGDILRPQLAGILTAFVVTDSRDRNQLYAILSKYKNNNTSIIISERDIFDFAHGEPPERYHTVLRALEISDPWVVRILINNNQIERLLLSDTRQQLQEDLVQLSGGIGWSADKFNVRVYSDGGIQSTGLNTRPAKGPQALLLTGRDSNAEIQHWKDEIAALDAEGTQLQERVNVRKSAYMQKKAELDRIKEEDKALYHEHRAAKRRFSDLQDEANEELPADSAALQAAREDSVEAKANAERQQAITLAQREESTNKSEETEKLHKEVEEEITRFNLQRQEFTIRLGKLCSDRAQIQSDINHWATKRQEQTDEIEKAQSDADLAQKEFKNWTAAALDFCDGEEVETRRSPDRIASEIASVEKALKAREKRIGESVGDLANKLTSAREAMEKVERDWNQTHDLNKALRASLLIRLHRWQEFRRHIALRCKLIFGFNLSHRGYFGKVIFNHDAQTLTLRVQTDDQLKTQGANADKDPKSLSGGEKSFSTICLLLSLWDSIGCPLRCLDEFDVFMDAINRRISMKMMIATATANPDKQYILITPQDMTNIHIGGNVRVHRMLDPVRRDTLNMAAA